MAWEDIEREKHRERERNTERETLVRRGEKEIASLVKKSTRNKFEREEEEK